METEEGSGSHRLIKHPAELGATTPASPTTQEMVQLLAVGLVPCGRLGPTRVADVSLNAEPGQATLDTNTLPHERKTS